MLKWKGGGGHMCGHEGRSRVLDGSSVEEYPSREYTTFRLGIRDLSIHDATLGIAEVGYSVLLPRKPLV